MATISNYRKLCSKVVFGTKEWAEYNENIIDGCIHDCRYCYSKEMAIRFKRKTALSWSNEALRPNYRNKKISLRSGRIMFPSTHDIHPKHLMSIIDYLGKLLEIGNTILVVTKPHYECISKICSTFLEYRSQILFRFTIGSLNTDTLRFWEPEAPSFEERFSCVEYAFSMGYETSVSCEPALDDNISVLIRKLLPYITNSIWIGKPNLLFHRLKMNGYSDEKTMKEAHILLSQLSDQYFKNLYHEFEGNPVVKWKESVKRIVGIDVPVTAGLDI